MRLLHYSFLGLVLASLSANPLGAQGSPTPHASPSAAQAGPIRPSGVLKHPLPEDHGWIASWRSTGDDSTGAFDVSPPLPPSPENRRRNLLVGGLVGAIAGTAVAASVCSDSDGVCLFSPAILLPIGGAGVGMIVALLLTPVH